jgi:choline dehydrogenase-like flavoprotein
MTADPDFLIIGSGVGGATLAASLAGSGARITILERGERLRHSAEARDLRAIFKHGHFRSGEHWYDASGTAFAPGNFYYVGGNSKFYGAVMYRYRVEDFTARQHLDGTSVSWPFGYDEFEPWYCKAEELYGVRGDDVGDDSAPPRSLPYPFAAIAHEPQIADAAARLSGQGLHPSPLPLSVDLDAWLKQGQTPWDGVPNTGAGKIDAETGPLAKALADPNISLLTGCEVLRLLVSPDGRRIEAVEVRRNGETSLMRGGTVILAAGAVQSAVLMQRSDRRTGPGGVANSNGAVGRYFMNHNTTAMITFDPRRRFDTVHSKTLGLNDFYNTGGPNGVPLGNVQLRARAGRESAASAA